MELCIPLRCVFSLRMQQKSFAVYDAGACCCCIIDIHHFHLKCSLGCDPDHPVQTTLQHRMLTREPLAPVQVNMYKLDFQTSAHFCVCEALTHMTKFSEQTFQHCSASLAVYFHLN